MVWTTEQYTFVQQRDFNVIGLHVQMFCFINFFCDCPYAQMCIYKFYLFISMFSSAAESFFRSRIG
jgi:hypothetical protein